MIVMKKIALILIYIVIMFSACNNKGKENLDKDAGTLVVKDMYERTGDELSIVAVMKVKPEAIKEIMPIFQALVQGSQEEDGCISYNLHQDINDSTRFVMLEEWKSQEAIDFHNTTEHYKKFKELSKDIIEKSEVTILKLVY